MRLLLLLLFFTPTFALSQSFPFDISFGKLYSGEYDPDGHKSTSIALSKEYHYVSVSFDGNSRMSCSFYNRGVVVDTLVLDMFLLEESRGADFIEYKYTAYPGNLFVFLRYALHGVPGIMEISVFENKLTNFMYIKDGKARKSEP